jgi:hypothetical protein
MPSGSAAMATMLGSDEDNVCVVTLKVIFLNNLLYGSTPDTLKMCP